MAAPVLAATSTLDGGYDSRSITKPTGTASGDLLIAVFTYYSGAQTVLPPSGWTFYGEFLDNGGSDPYDTRSCIYYKVAGGSEPASYSWDVTGSSYWNMMTVRITGADTTTPIQDVTMAARDSDGSPTPDYASTSTGLAGITTSVDDTLLVGNIACYDSTPGNNTITGWTAGTSYDADFCRVFSRTVATAGSVSDANTGETESISYVGLTIAVNPVASSGTTGSGAPTLARSAGAGSGSTGTEGSGAPSLARHTASGSGSTTGPTTGSGAPSLVRHTGAGTGSTGTEGSGSPSLTRHAASGSGSTTGIEGSSATTLVRHTASGSGSTTEPTGTSGSGAPELARHTASGSGSTGTEGSSATTLVRHTASGAGSTGNTGSGAPSLARHTAAGVGSTGTSGSGSPTLVRHTAAGSGSTTIGGVTGSGVPTLGRHSAAGSGTCSGGTPAVVQIQTAGQSGAQLTGLSKDARRTEILRAKNLAELDSRVLVAESDIDALEAATTPSAWTSLTLSAGWTGTLSYRKINDIVYLRGPALVAGTIGVTMATLPSGFRPPGTVVLVSACDGGAPRLVGVQVDSSGNISIQNYYGGGTVSNVYAGHLSFSVTA